VARQVDGLEKMLGVQLVRRSTRRVVLTDAGQTYFEQAARILDDVETAHQLIAGLDAVPRGLLRVTAANAFGRRHIAPCLPKFLARYPEMQVELVLSDSLLNMVEDNIDLAVRIGVPSDTSLVARKLADHRRVVCGSTAYVKAHGTPQKPSDLVDHRCLSLARRARQTTWRFQQGSHSEDIRVTGPLHSNDSEVLLGAALAGVGLVLLPTWLVGDEVQRGKLTPVLANYEANTGPTGSAIYAMFLPGRRSMLKLRCLLDFLVDVIGPTPYWERAPASSARRPK
jgi:DNA-binding transcriptional LysR family regulator